MTEVSSLFAKWITHDLATPAATVLTASELLGAQGDAEINELVHGGAKRLVARLRLIRAAFAPGAAPLAAAALERLLREGIETTPITWAHPADASGVDAALVAGAALLLTEMAKGTAVTVTPDGVTWDTPPPASEALVRAFASLDPSDGRAALAAMVLHTATRAGRTVAATSAGISWR
jgi:hypothetical protein